MSTVKNFEELQAWQKARVLAGFVYELTRGEKFSRDWALCNQIRDAAGSVMHNIAEGFEAGYDPEFARFLKMARRSAAEVQSELYLALDANYITPDNLKKAYDLAVEAKKLINGMLKYLRNSD
ncbi:MAG: four helix bundle protein [Chloroflexi bacterium]|nr:four helix bundle protein [Chloroflexota bacterium]